MNGHPITLLVEGNDDHAQAISQAMTGQGLPQPRHMRTGEEAVLWSSMNEVDICVLNYTLRGINGMETMVRLHQRKPDVPVVMLSKVKSEQIAVTAFRRGVRDFVPMTAGYVDELAEIIVNVAQGLTCESGPMVHANSPSQEVGYLRPTYENRLRAIGRQLDLYRYRAINLSEVSGGFLVRALPCDGRAAEALEFPDRDAPHILTQAVTSRGEGERDRPSDDLLPTGYEDFLRALGHRLDDGHMQAVTVTELEPLIAVGGLVPADNSHETHLVPYYELLQSDQIKYMLDDGFRRRSTQRSGFARLLGVG